MTEEQPGEYEGIPKYFPLDAVFRSASGVLRSWRYNVKTRSWMSAIRVRDAVDWTTYMSDPSNFIRASQWDRFYMHEPVEPMGTPEFLKEWSPRL